MTKKNFEALARAIFQAKQESLRVPPPPWGDTFRKVINNIADACKASNPRFNRERFIEACETGTTRGMRGPK